MKLDDLTKKRKKHTSRLVAVFLTILLIFSAMAIYITAKSKSNFNKATINIYYYDPIAHELVPVKKEVSGATVSLLVLDIFDKLKTSSDNSLFSVIPQNVTLLSSNIADSICFVNLKTNSDELKTISIYSEYAAVYGIVNTLTEIDGIKSVQFSLNGEHSAVFAHFVAIDKPLSHYNGSFPKSAKVNLFFPTPDFKTLVIEQREIIYETDPTKNCENILNELFRGSYYGLPNLFSNAHCDNFSIQSGGTAVVNLSDTIFKKPLGANLENLFVESIVNTLTESHDIQSVQIEVGGHILDSLFGSVNVSSPIRRFFGDNTKYLVPYYTFEFDDNEFYVPVPSVSANYDIESLFKLLKEPNDASFISKIPPNANITGQTIISGVLNITVDLGYVPTSKDLDTIKRQIALSFTEIPNINTVNLHIGEENFLLGR
jgi:spore germination protein GerM